MTLIKKRNEFPVFGDMMTNLFEERFFEPLKRHTAFHEPFANISMTEKAFIIQLASPGLSKEAFSIDLKNNTLIVSATKKENEEQSGNFSLREFNFTAFKRTFTLPKNADQQAITASYTDGILEIVINKKEDEAELVKKIEIA